MDITIGDAAPMVTAIFAGLALLFSIITFRKQERLTRELGNLQRELAVLELRDARERELSKSKAEFSARFASYNNGKQLVITNVGEAQARDVRIDFGDKAHFVISSLIEGYFPCDIDRADSVKLIATSSAGVKAVKESFTLTWMDDAGGGSKYFNVQYF